MMLSNLCVGKWHGILTQLGIDQSHLTGKHTACPICGGRDRFRFDNKAGKGTFICNQCGAGDGFDLLMKATGCNFKTAATQVEGIVGTVETTKVVERPDPRVALKRIGAGLQRLNGKDPASLYLRHRGLHGIASFGLRYHPELAYFEQGQRLGAFPAMVAKVCNAQGGGETYHITYLTPDGRKADVPAVKKVMPPINTITGAAIRLAPAADHIGITEGIENGLAVMEGEGIACWSAVSAGGIETFDPPEGVKRVTIFADNDYNYTGHKAAYTLANRLIVRRNIEAEVCISAAADYLDQLIGSRRNAA